MSEPDGTQASSYPSPGRKQAKQLIDKKLSRQTKVLAKKVHFFGGSPAEQRKRIYIILENHLETLDVDRRLRQIRKLSKEVNSFTSFVPFASVVLRGLTAFVRSSSYRRLDKADTERETASLKE